MWVEALVLRETNKAFWLELHRVKVAGERKLTHDAWVPKGQISGWVDSDPREPQLPPMNRAFGAFDLSPWLTSKLGVSPW